MKKWMCQGFLLVGIVSLVGCGGQQQGNTVENASQSDIDEYNRLLQQSQASMQDSEKAAKESGVKGF
ncbi:hypothetical protein NHH03_18450 [Stieleria sp. TO1_6]|uniref:hypothetical protein n=1 Tax=Stieleria tagensis TaxID=2956795 RepID=UPI00209B9F10|nr:hypothetical protein [Stieleria tagensis]MCO8123733.1 hypothetical protein [Stieleria tagensis]